MSISERYRYLCSIDCSPLPSRSDDRFYEQGRAETIPSRSAQVNVAWNFICLSDPVIGRRVANDLLLARGYHAASGGGDARLNDETAIRPHAYLKDGSGPTQPMVDTFSFEQLRDIINVHLDEGIGNALTPFASFTSRWQSADAFAKSDQSKLMVVDTTLCRDIEIYHTKDLCEAGLCAVWYPDEYLAFGPVPGTAFRTVNAAEFRQQGYHQIADGHTGHHGFGTEHLHTGTYLHPADVALAKKLATAVWPDSGTRATEIVTALTVNFVGVRLYHLEERMTAKTLAWVTAMIVNELCTELNDLVKAARHGRKLQLVNSLSKPWDVSSGTIIMRRILLNLERTIYMMARNRAFADAYSIPEASLSPLMPSSPCEGLFSASQVTFVPFEFLINGFYSDHTQDSLRGCSSPLSVLTTSSSEDEDPAGFNAIASSPLVSGTFNSWSSFNLAKRTQAPLTSISFSSEQYRRIEDPVSGPGAAYSG